MPKYNLGSTVWWNRQVSHAEISLGRKIGNDRFVIPGVRESRNDALIFPVTMADVNRSFICFHSPHGPVNPEPGFHNRNSSLDRVDAEHGTIGLDHADVGIASVDPPLGDNHVPGFIKTKCRRAGQVGHEQFGLKTVRAFQDPPIDRAMLPE